MATPKKPQDHQPKIVKPKVTKTDAGWDVEHKGVKLTVLTEALNDFELLDDLAALQVDEARSAHRIPLMLRRLAGNDGFKAVTDGLRGENGRVPIPETVQFVLEVFQALNPNS